MKKLITSEMVSSGHPDKVADQIADAILDEVLKQDPKAHSAVEVTVSTGNVDVFGELTTTAYVDIRQIVIDTLKVIGYDKPELGFSADSININNRIVAQSVELDKLSRDLSNEDIGAGDQGIIYGYATNETEEYMPLSYVLARKMLMRLELVRKNQEIEYLGPDAKGEVTLENQDAQNKLHSIVLSTQHRADVSQDQIKQDLIKQVLDPVFSEYNLSLDTTNILINPSGSFALGGPAVDSGLTGRKIIVDTYGGFARHGGGAFSGKDGTKVDRSAAYMARYAAKNLVAAGVADRLEIQVGYAIGVAEPVSVSVDAFGTEKISYDVILQLINDNFDFRPGVVIENMHLATQKYLPLASFGHFGRIDLKEQPEWEKLDKKDLLKNIQ